MIVQWEKAQGVQNSKEEIVENKLELSLDQREREQKIDHSLWSKGAFVAKKRASNFNEEKNRSYNAEELG